MSKITICEGKIKWTSKGNTVLHAFDGDISFSAGECNIWNGEQGNEAGEYIAEAVGRQNEKFIACIDFYRSREHSEGKYGKLDTQYNGEFGFDRFDSKVCAEGLFSEYEKIRTVLTSENTYGKEKVYLCPYLSIWPPEIKVDGKTIKKKNEVTLFVKANKATDISKKNERATKATIVFSLEGENLKNEIVISPNKLDLEIGKEAKPISIKCNASFEKDIKLIAKSVDEGQVLGQLIIKANAVVYQTTLQPIEIIFGSANKDIANDLPTTIDNRFFEKLVEYLNTKSFNQAYIHLTLASTIKQVTFSKQEFEIKGLFYTKDGDTYLKMGRNDHKDELNDDEKKDQSKALEYNNLVENRYAARLNNLQNEQNQKERVDKKRQIFINEFKKYYKYKESDNSKKVNKYRSEKMVKTIWGKKDITALFEEWKKEEEAYLQMESNSISLDKKGQLHAFFTKDILTAGNPKRKTLAYSAPASGVSHIFKEAFINADEKAFATIAHELGHALGLCHTFDSRMGVYIKEQENDRETVNKKIEDKIKELKEKQKSLKKIETNKVEEQSSDIEEEYKTLYEYTTYNTFSKSFQEKIDNIIQLEEIEIESQTQKGLSEGSEKTNNIATLEKEIQALEKEIYDLKNIKTQKTIKYSKVKEQSTTLENFMDYEQYKDSNPNTDFLRKTFYQWQWREMQNIGFSRKYLIKTIFILLLFCVSSCKTTHQSFVKYYAYESKEKFSNGLPVQYYTLESSPNKQIIRFSSSQEYDEASVLKIYGGKKHTFIMGYLEDIYEEGKYMISAEYVKETLFNDLYIITNKKAYLRYNNVNEMLSNETIEYLKNKNILILPFWFPPEMKRVKNIDYSKFPKNTMIK